MAIGMMDQIQEKLRPGIPSILGLINFIGSNDLEYLSRFRALVEEFIPEYREDVMSFSDNNEKVGRFFYLFSEKYFELDEDLLQSAFENEESVMGEMVNCMQFGLFGFSTNDYHEFTNLDQGRQILLSIVDYQEVENDSRIPILMKMRNIFEEYVTAKIPERPWERAEIHQMVDGTEYAGLGDFADFINSMTGCRQLDFNWEDYAYEYTDWEMELIAELTKESVKMVEIMDKISALETRITKRGEFEKLLDFLIKEEVVQNDRNKK